MKAKFGNVEIEGTSEEILFFYKSLQAEKEKVVAVKPIQPIETDRKNIIPNRNTWSKEEDKYIKENYKRGMVEKIAEHLGKSTCAVKNRIFKLNIKISKKNHPENKKTVAQADKSGEKEKLRYMCVECGQEPVKTKTEICSVCEKLHDSFHG